jgi:hypothetical protein
LQHLPKRAPETGSKWWANPILTIIYCISQVLTRMAAQCELQL